MKSTQKGDQQGLGEIEGLEEQYLRAGPRRKQAIKRLILKALKRLADHQMEVNQKWPGRPTLLMGEELEQILGSETLDQVDVFDRANQIPNEERHLSYPRLRALFTVSTSIRQPLHAQRAAQVACAWMPGSLDVVVDGLESLSSEVRFSVLCSLADVDESVIALVQSRLLPTVWQSIITSKASDVEVMGADALLLFPLPLVRELVSGTNRRKISGFLRGLLKEAGLL